MIKLYHVNSGDVVDYSYLTALAVELYMCSTSPLALLASNDSLTVNGWVDYLVEHFPKKFEL